MIGAFSVPQALNKLQATSYLEGTGPGPDSNLNSNPPIVTTHPQTPNAPSPREQTTQLCLLHSHCLLISKQSRLRRRPSHDIAAEGATANKMTERSAPSPSPLSMDDGLSIDDRNATQPSSPIRADPRTSLQHVLDDSESRQNTPSASKLNADLTEDEEASTPRNVKQETPSAPTATGGRKKKDPAAGGTPMNSSIYSGNKVRHLKKDDGEPLWRKDIQFDFLRTIFEDDRAVFTNTYEPGTIGKQTFANLYIDAMARSSKTSKILRDKLLTEHEPAKNMAMVCLLVNLGRMNTTLNCDLPLLDTRLSEY